MMAASLVHLDPRSRERLVPPRVFRAVGVAGTVLLGLGLWGKLANDAWTADTALMAGVDRSPIEADGATEANVTEGAAAPVESTARLPLRSALLVRSR